ncbi:hypothetical protein M7I_3103 [Glarea lozoyensis 74030]|uniref:Uncharacterized protein n=1 Tax=Glarea lozoyensis (strain ATCC 74030 / MF5533) TaxID=1104152 RepID=H0EKK5_GLAL7|nr:hypothetical protein M7I_3103 [Glarea lozoyensis 74030]
MRKAATGDWDVPIRRCRTLDPYDFSAPYDPRHPQLPSIYRSSDDSRMTYDPFNSELPSIYRKYKPWIQTVDGSDNEPVEYVSRQCTADRYLAAARAARAIKGLRDDEAIESIRDDEAKEITRRVRQGRDAQRKVMEEEEMRVRRKMFEETVKLIPAPLNLVKGKEAKA